MMISSHPRAIAVSALTVALFVAASPSLAQSLEVAPVSVRLDAGAMATTLNVTNRAASTSTIQVRGFSWDQPGGTDRLVPTDALMVSPPIVAVEPGISQVIRVVLRQPPSDVEQSYRLFIDQVPRSSGPGGIQIALRLSIPVFVEPLRRVTSALQWRLDRFGSALVATNNGEGHARVQNLTLSLPTGIKLHVAPNLTPYVLPGSNLRWRILERIDANLPIRLTGTTDEGPIDETFNASGP